MFRLCSLDGKVVAFHEGGGSFVELVDNKDIGQAFLAIEEYVVYWIVVELTTRESHVHCC